MYRVGNGYDVHKFAKGRRLVIGGIEIDSQDGFDLGLDGHSDADVLVHAIIDALLGAAALGDIGQRFPPTDDRYKDIDSCVLLAKTGELLWQNGYIIVNIDSVIVAEKPKLSEYIPAMRRKIADICHVEYGCVSVKATTEEGLGLAGKGIGAHCVVGINRVSE